MVLLPVAGAALRTRIPQDRLAGRVDPLGQRREFWDRDRQEFRLAWVLFWPRSQRSVPAALVTRRLPPLSRRSSYGDDLCQDW